MTAWEQDFELDSAEVWSLPTLGFAQTVSYRFQTEISTFISEQNLKQAVLSYAINWYF